MIDGKVWHAADVAILVALALDFVAELGAVDESTRLVLESERAASTVSADGALSPDQFIFSFY